MKSNTDNPTALLMKRHKWPSWDGNDQSAVARKTGEISEIREHFTRERSQLLNEKQKTGCISYLRVNFPGML
eukprot:TRINITY_DN2904_c0_g1_i1.p1 TRINITY_DN2904_c0_g1~~TRINITY_DN2904_c0_g1_i1.p1  ORF type:complete len:72 (+),score=4.02 TRINITY_DN2904_c0_g1_i1:226-441(+)